GQLRPAQPGSPPQLRDQLRLRGAEPGAALRRGEPREARVRQLADLRHLPDRERGAVHAGLQHLGHRQPEPDRLLHRGCARRASRRPGQRQLVRSVRPAQHDRVRTAAAGQHRRRVGPQLPDRPRRQQPGPVDPEVVPAAWPRALRAPRRRVQCAQPHAVLRRELDRELHEPHGDHAVEPAVGRQRQLHLRQPQRVRHGERSARSADHPARGAAAVLAVIVRAGFAATAATVLLAAASSQVPPPKDWTAADDHRHMLEQLGIRSLRPGPSGNEQAPNHANYDEAAANPFPVLPDPLTLNDGRKVATPQAWWRQRRAEIVELFEREVYGRVPAGVPSVAWTVTHSEDVTVGGRAAVARQITGHADNSAYPALNVDIALDLVLPAAAPGPVPVVIMFRPALSRVEGPRGLPGSSPAFEQLLAHGWGYATLDPASIQADNGAGLTRGIIGLANQGQPRRPDDWGALRAWAWGASRAFDYLQTDRAVDARRIGIEGVSRYGKAALVTMAFDQRFAMVLVGSSGEGGAKLHRRNWGEAVENLTGSGEYHWMAGNFLKYGAADASFGSRNAGDLPVDAHELIALCAPRLTFISYGVPEKGDAKWLDHQGSFMAAIAAQAVFRVLGAKDLGRSDDYRTEKMPAVNVGLLEGQLAWRQHDGGHTDGPNFEHFIAWAERLVDTATVPR